MIRESPASQPMAAEERPRAENVDSPSSSHSPYRTAQATLVDDVDRPSIATLPSATKDRAVLTVLSGPAMGLVATLESNCVTLGRSSDDADIVIPDPSLSRVHARIRCLTGPAGKEYLLEDAGSTNGTYLGQDRISYPVGLADGARVGLGRRTFLRFSIQDSLEEAALRRVHESALHDGLTGVHNRSVFDDRLTTEMAFARRHKRPLSLMMIDVDHFKRFNDAHGHQAGDAALQHVAALMSNQLRTEDLIARYGGEEFVILIRDAEPRHAERVAHRIRTAVERTALRWPADQHADPSRQAALSVTLSIGVSHFRGESSATPADMVRTADRALYQAKHHGRNCVVDAGEVRPMQGSSDGRAQTAPALPRLT